MSALGLRVPSVESPYKRQTPTLWQVIGQSIWRGLEASGQRRAARELRQLAERWQTIDPALAQQLREASRHDTGR
jgi:hypothetical protein